MAENPQVLDLLEVILDQGKTPEEACRDCPELLPEVRERWQRFRRLDAEIVALFPGIQTAHEAIPLPSLTHPDGLPRIPGYEVEALLGRGGMGVVYKARHLALKRTVALKMLAVGNPYLAERTRFRTEAEAVARLQHPNIVQIHEIGEAEGRPFFALEYVAGGSLAERLLGQFLPANDAARLVAALAEAMHLAHSRNLVHRDLKPGNVLLVGAADTPIGQCHPKVTDFGLVRQLDADSGQTRDGVVMGTPSYMAPEQAEGRAHSAGPAADVYALGAILYECLTARPPFQGATALETLEQVRTREPAAPSALNGQVPRDLETICLKCLRKEPERRYSSARELADDLGRFVRGEPVAARPVGRLERVAKWRRRNPTVSSLSAVAALALVAGTVVSLVFGVLASRRAEELEHKTSQLQAQTLAAQESARLAKENEDKIGQVLVSGLLIPIGLPPHTLTDSLDAIEVDALRKLRSISPALRLQLLETALSNRDSARRVGLRANWLIQAIVGGDRALRADVLSLVLRRIQEPDAPPEVRFACARLGLAVNVTDRAWAEPSADALLMALRDPQTQPTDFPLLAEELVAVCEHLPPTRAEDHVAAALDLYFTRAFTGNNLFDQGRTMVALSSRFNTATATRAADRLTDYLCQLDCIPYLWPYLCPALVAVCRRLPASEAAAHINRTIDFLLARRYTTKESYRSNYLHLTPALGTLCGRLDSARAYRVAEAILAILGDSQMVGKYKSENFLWGHIPVLTQVAEFLDPADGLRAAEGLILTLREAESFLSVKDQLSTALVALCRRLDAAGSVRMAEALTAAARDPKTSKMAVTVFAEAFALLAGQLPPAQAASVEGTLVDSLLLNLLLVYLGDAKSRVQMGYVGQALGTISGRPGATTTARVAEFLFKVIKYQQAQISDLEPLTTALVRVCAQLPQQESSSLEQQTLDVLDSLWNARTAPLDRASIAVAMAAVWPHRDRADASARAQTAAAYLEGALRNANPGSLESITLARALPAVYNPLEPAERCRQANSGADALLAALRNSKNLSITSSILSQPFATMSAHLDQAGVTRIVDALFVLMDDSSVQPGTLGSIPHVDRFGGYETLLKKIAVRLEERDLRRLLAHPLAVHGLQRILLDALPGLPKRSYRNLWDYLDSIE